MQVLLLKYDYPLNMMFHRFVDPSDLYTHPDWCPCCQGRYRKWTPADEIAMAAALETPEGRQMLAEKMVGPIKLSLELQALEKHTNFLSIMTNEFKAAKYEEAVEAVKKVDDLYEVQDRYVIGGFYEHGPLCVCFHCKDMRRVCRAYLDQLGKKKYLAMGFNLP